MDTVSGPDIVRDRARPDIVPLNGEPDIVGSTVQSQPEVSFFYAQNSLIFLLELFQINVLITERIIHIICFMIENFHQNIY